MRGRRVAPFHECSQEEQKVLHLLFHYSPDLRLAYDFCFDLTWILNQQITPGAGKRKIKGWIRRVRNSGLTCFNSVLKTIETWMIEITNYFIGRDSSGFVEGLNNKIKVIKRRCYGVTNITHLFQRIYLDLVGYSKYNNINKLQISVST
jgi:transposase